MENLFEPQGKTFLVTGGASGLGAQYVETFIKEGARETFFKINNKAFDFTMKGIKHMRKDSGGAGGTIVNVSSIVALYRLRFLPIYCGSKAAVLHFSQCISGGNFHEKTGVRILTICFGPTETALMEGIEHKIWDESSVEQLLEDAVEPPKMESAVAAVHKMFKEAPNDSIWLSIGNKPVKNLTPLVDAAFTEFERVMFS